MEHKQKILAINPDNIILLSSLLFKYPQHMVSIKKKVFHLLQDLTVAPELNTDIFLSILFKIHDNPLHNIFVYYDPFKMDIIALFTLIFEPKLIRNGKKVAHLEDFVIHKDYRKRSLGTQLLRFIIDKSKKENCYKILLNSNEETLQFYTKNFFKQKDINVCMYM